MRCRRSPRAEPLKTGRSARRCARAADWPPLDGCVPGGPGRGEEAHARLVVRLGQGADRPRAPVDVVQRPGVPGRARRRLRPGCGGLILQGVAGARILAEVWFETDISEQYGWLFEPACLEYDGWQLVTIKDSRWPRGQELGQGRPTRIEPFGRPLVARRRATLGPPHPGWESLAMFDTHAIGTRRRDHRRCTPADRPRLSAGVRVSSGFTARPSLSEAAPAGRFLQSRCSRSRRSIPTQASSRRGGPRHRGVWSTGARAPERLRTCSRRKAASMRSPRNRVQV